MTAELPGGPMPDQDKPVDLGIYARSDAGYGLGPTEVVAGLLSVIWVVAVIAMRWSRLPPQTKGCWGW